jgi:uncharacterized protein (DUF2237 family)
MVGVLPGVLPGDYWCFTSKNKKRRKKSKGGMAIPPK